MVELPDWLRGIILLGHDGAEYRVVSLDENGQLGVVLKAIAEVTIPGDVSVDQNDSIREMQGIEGANLRTVRVDASGQIIMVPRGQSGNYMLVDAAGYLTTAMKGIEGANLRTIAVDADGNLISVIKGLEGANLRNIAVDASGRIVMVPYGTTAVSQDDSVREIQGKDGETLRTLLVDAQGRIIMVAYGTVTVAGAVTTTGTATVTQTDSIREIQGAEGANLHTIAVDASGQMIMVPRGQSGNYMRVNSDGYLSTVIKGEKDGVLRTLRTDEDGRLLAKMVGQYGEEVASVAVDASGQMIMVPRGQSGNYMSVDSDGFLSTAIKGEKDGVLRTLRTDADGRLLAKMVGMDGEEVVSIAVDASGRIIMVPYGTTVVSGTATVTQTDSIREMQGKEGANLHTIVVDAAGQMIMVPRGQSGNYLGVDSDGFMTAVMKGVRAGELHTLRTDADGRLLAKMVGMDGDEVVSVAVDASGQMIMVPRGQSGNYLGVDSDGFMTAVMKGTYGATLKTLATDNDGYLIAMLKDAEDQWGAKTSVGLGELAARLGSPMSWDRRGQVVQMQTFVDGLGYGIGAASGDGSSHGLDTGVFQTGKQSYKLVTGTTVDKSAGVTLYSDYSPSGRLGFEFTFSIADQPDYVYALGRVWTGIVESRNYLRWVKATNKLQILNSGNVYEDVCDFQLPAVPQLFVSVKVVCDVLQQEWVRLLSRGVEYDLSGVYLYQPLSAVHPYLTYQVQAKEDNAVSHTIYVDRMIITTNEP